MPHVPVLGPSSGTEIHDIKTPVKNSCTGKSIPLQTWTGPEGSKRLRLPDFKTIGK